MGSQVPKTIQGSAVVDANGNATVDLGQVPAGCSWRNVSTLVQSTSTSFSTAVLYKGLSDTVSNQIDTTGPLGGNGNTSQIAWTLQPGDHFRVVWSGATPGSSCQATTQLIQTFAGGAPMRGGQWVS